MLAHSRPDNSRTRIASGRLARRTPRLGDGTGQGSHHAAFGSGSARRCDSRWV